jgi:hypothetical protein
VQPPATEPSAAEVLAASQAAARAKAAQQKAERLKKQRRAVAATRRAAARRAAEARKREAARRDQRGQQPWSTASDGRGANKAVLDSMPFVAAAAVAALLILGLALVPAYAVPWYRMSVVLEDHREQFAVVGAMTLLGIAVFLSLTLLSQ